jgi:hypothetical protein
VFYCPSAIEIVDASLPAARHFTRLHRTDGVAARCARRPIYSHVNNAHAPVLVGLGKRFECLKKWISLSDFQILREIIQVHYFR